MGSLGFNMVPSSPDLDWTAYFAEYSEQLAAAKAERAGETPEGEDEEEAVEAFWVTEQAVEIGVSDLGTKPKAVFLAAQAMGWEPHAWRSRSHHEPVLFASISKEGAANHHDVGDIRYPAFERRTYQIRAKSPSAPIGFRAFWIGKDDLSLQRDWDDRAFYSRRWRKSAPVDPAKVKTGSWDYGIGYDPLGIPVENYVDYTFSSANKSPVEIKQLKRRAFDLDSLYNDGKTRMESQPLFRSAADFTVWLDDWLEMLAPDHKKLTPVAKEKAPAPEFPDLQLSEWSAE